MSQAPIGAPCRCSTAGFLTASPPAALSGLSGRGTVQAGRRLQTANAKALSAAEQFREAEQRVEGIEDLLELIFERCCENQAQEVHRAELEARNTSQVQELQHEMRLEIEAKLRTLRETLLGVERDVAETIGQEKAVLKAQQVEWNLKLLEAMEEVNSLQGQVMSESAAALEKAAVLEREIRAERHTKDELLAAQFLAEQQHARDREADAHRRNRFAEDMRALQEQVRFVTAEWGCFNCESNADVTSVFLQLRQEQEKRELETQMALERRIALEKKLHEERENRLAEEIGRVRAELLETETQCKAQLHAGARHCVRRAVCTLHTCAHRCR